MRYYNKVAKIKDSKHSKIKEKMRILLRLPNWLGDGVMVTPSIEMLKEKFPNATFSIIAPSVVCELFKNDKRITKIYIDSTKKAKSRLLATFRLAREVGKHDIAITFTNHFYSALLLFLTRSKIRIGYNFSRKLFLTHTLKHSKEIHQVLSYANLLNPLFSVDSTKVGNLKLEIAKSSKNSNALKILDSKISSINTQKPRQNLIIGLNPGGAYGSSKRWLKEYFAIIARYFLAQSHIVVLFGSKDDITTCKTIESMIKDKSLLESNLASIDSNLLDSLATNALDHKESNLINLCDKTTLQELMSAISRLDVFITNDSGPMHIAVALKTPTIAMFGSTNVKRCPPWKFKDCVILYENLECSPCFKRNCPLLHHNCMKLITPQKVIDATHKLLALKEKK